MIDDFFIKKVKDILQQYRIILVVIFTKFPIKIYLYFYRKASNCTRLWEKNKGNSYAYKNISRL